MYLWVPYYCRPHLHMKVQKDKKIFIIKNCPGFSCIDWHHILKNSSSPKAHFHPYIVKQCPFQGYYHINISSYLTLHSTLEKNKHHIQNQRKKLPNIIPISLENISHRKLPCTPPQVHLSDISPVVP